METRKHYWLDAVVHGERHREPLGTTDSRQARDLEKKRIAEFQKSPPDPTKRSRKLGALDVKAAIDVFADERRSQVSARMVRWWKEMGGPLGAFFGNKPFRTIAPTIWPRIKTHVVISGEHQKTSTASFPCCDRS